MPHSQTAKTVLEFVLPGGLDALPEVSSQMKDSFRLALF
jgi:hypothetical protein